MNVRERRICVLKNFTWLLCVPWAEEGRKGEEETVQTPHKAAGCLRLLRNKLGKRIERTWGAEDEGEKRGNDRPSLVQKSGCMVVPITGSGQEAALWFLCR